MSNEDILDARSSPGEYIFWEFTGPRGRGGTACRRPLRLRGGYVRTRPALFPVHVASWAVVHVWRQSIAPPPGERKPGAQPGSAPIGRNGAERGRGASLASSRHEPCERSQLYSQCRPIGIGPERITASANVLHGGTRSPACPAASITPMPCAIWLLWARNGHSVLRELHDAL